MNPKERNKYIAFGVLIVVAVGVFIYQINQPLVDTPPTTQQPAGTQPARPAAAPATAPGASAFVQTEVDINQLLASVQEVDFNYDLERPSRNPMTPLVGIVTIGDGPPPPPGTGTRAEVIARGMVVTGIVYDSAEPMAIIENKTDQQVDVVTVGHEFPIGILVESIEESRVVLRVGDMGIPKMLEER